MKIFLVDDEEDIRELVSLQLKKNGYSCYAFKNGKNFLERIEKELPDLIILDLMLPDYDGLDICKKIKNNKYTSHIPIIILSAKGEELDKIIGLELGADDYLAKPFSIRELSARVKAVLRRGNVKEENKDEVISLFKGNLIIDKTKYQIFLEGNTLDVTTTEFKVMYCLANHIGKVYSRQKILDYLWGKDKIVIDRTVDVHIKNLREKLGKYSHIIKNVRGVGYKIENNF